LPIEGESMSERNSVSYFALTTARKGPPVVPVSPKTIKTGEQRKLHDRHGAITDKGDWKNYKRWAATARDAWDKEHEKNDEL
jgi:hypothetical protein